MKKSSLLIICLVLISFVSAVDLSSVQDTANKVNDATNQLTNPLTQEDYVREHWLAFFKESTIGQKLAWLELQLKSLDFLWKFLIGFPFAWSFTFILAFTLWLSLGSWIYKLLAFFELWDHKIHWLIAFSCSTLSSVLGITNLLVSILTGFVTTFTSSFFFQLFIQIAILLGVIYVGMITSSWEKLFLAIKNRREEKQLKEDVKELKQDVKERKQKEELSGGGFDYTKYDIT